MSIKELRERTQAGLMDCKKAWEASNGDMNVAIEFLKQKGLAKAVKRAGVEATEGGVVVGCEGDVCGMLFFGSETDFVARSDAFCKFVNQELSAFLKYCVGNDIRDYFSGSDVSSLTSGDMEKKEEPFSDRLAYLASTIGENITLKGFYRVSKGDCSVFTYVHNKLSEEYVNVAKIGVVLKIRGPVDEVLGKQIAMHIASFKPSVISRSQLNQAWMESNNVEGVNLESRIKEAVLEEQSFLMDNLYTVKALCANRGIEIVEFNVLAVR